MAEKSAIATLDGPDFRLAQLDPEVIARSTRLRAAVQGAGGAKVVEQRSGVPHSTLQAYAKGQDWKVSAAAKLAKACGVALEWLVFGDGDLMDNLRVPGTAIPITAAEVSELLAADYVKIPRLDVKASAGMGNTVTSEKIAGHLAFDEDFLRNTLHRRPEDLVLITADGDSMDPTIRDGDLLLIDTSVQTINNNSLYILDVNGSLLVKRAQMRLDGSVLIMSDNSKYQPEIVHPSERTPIRIIGQVVYQAGPVRS